MVYVIQEHAFGFQIGVASEDDPAKIARRRSATDAIGVSTNRIIMERMQLHRLVGSSQELHRAVTATEVGGRRAGIEVRFAHLEQGTTGDHHCDALRHQELRTIGERLIGVIDPDQVRPIVARGRQILVRASVTNNPQYVGGRQQTRRPRDIQVVNVTELNDRSGRRGGDRSRQCTGSHCGADSRLNGGRIIGGRHGPRCIDHAHSGNCKRARIVKGELRRVQAVVDGKPIAVIDFRGRVFGQHNPVADLPQSKVKRIVRTGERAIPFDHAGGIVVQLVDKHRRVARLEPELKDSAGAPRTISIDRSAIGIFQRTATFGIEADLKVVDPIGGATGAGIGNPRIVLVVAGTADTDKVGTCFQSKIQIRIVAVVAVVLSDQFDITTVGLAIQLQHTVQQTARPTFITQAFRDGLGGELPRFDQLELIQVDIGTRRRRETLQVYEVDITGQDIVKNAGSHVGWHIIGVPQPDRMPDFMEHDTRETITELAIRLVEQSTVKQRP